MPIPREEWSFVIARNVFETALGRVSSTISESAPISTAKNTLTAQTRCAGADSSATDSATCPSRTLGIHNLADPSPSGPGSQNLSITLTFLYICARRNAAPQRCTNLRARHAAELRETLFPGAIDPQAPRLLALALDLQAALSPVPALATALLIGAAPVLLALAHPRLAALVTAGALGAGTHTLVAAANTLALVHATFEQGRLVRGSGFMVLGAAGMGMLVLALVVLATGCYLCKPPPAPLLPPPSLDQQGDMLHLQGFVDVELPPPNHYNPNILPSRGPSLGDHGYSRYGRRPCRDGITVPPQMRPEDYGYV